MISYVPGQLRDESEKHLQSVPVNIKEQNGGMKEKQKEKSGKETEAEDPWSLPELVDTGTPWSGKIFSSLKFC